MLFFKQKEKNYAKIVEEIDKAEESLIQTLSPRVQLHLTVLGIFDNGFCHAEHQGRKQIKRQDKKITMLQRLLNNRRTETSQ
ncbi:MAG: hypothetical protein OXI43_04885 [Candidatus Poribacteria bacterium]|nr:hypothetical protein [Candidatus Poribacteria bacterium]